MKKPCPKCNGTGGSVQVRDYVRGDRTEFCERCDGYGTISTPDTGVKDAARTTPAMRAQIDACKRRLAEYYSPQDLRDLGYAQAAIDRAIDEIKEGQSDGGK